MSVARKLYGAIIAQVLGQAMIGWTILVHFTKWPEISVMAVVSLLAAAIVPFRHDGTLRDRATGNFGAGLVTAAYLFWDLILGGLDFITGTPSRLGAETLFMLVAAVLFTLAGGLFWTERDEGSD